MIIFSVEKKLEHIMFKEFKEISEEFIDTFTKNKDGVFPIYFLTQNKSEYDYKFKHKEYYDNKFLLPFCERKPIEPNTLDLYTWKKSPHIELCISSKNGCIINLVSEANYPKKIFIYGNNIDEKNKNFLLNNNYFDNQEIVKNELPTLINSGMFMKQLRKYS